MSCHLLVTLWKNLDFLSAWPKRLHSVIFHLTLDINMDTKTIGLLCFSIIFTCFGLRRTLCIFLTSSYTNKLTKRRRCRQCLILQFIYLCLYFQLLPNAICIKYILHVLKVGMPCLYTRKTKTRISHFKKNIFFSVTLQLIVLAFCH